QHAKGHHTVPDSSVGPGPGRFCFGPGFSLRQVFIGLGPGPAHLYL
ncbi:unnamed protein product, partial [Adineta steineri]